MSWGRVLEPFWLEVALRYLWSARMLKTFTTFAAAIFIAATAAISVAQETDDNAGSSPVYQLQAGRNRVDIFQKFTTILEHQQRIKTVLGFDEQVIQIEPIDGHPNQITVYALETGITSIDIIDELGNHLNVEVLVRGDVRHLENYLKRLFPNDDIHVEEIKGSVRLSGFVTKPQNINHIVKIAEQFFPTVMNHMESGGVQQVMLKATIMEVDRSKLRTMGMNFGLTAADGFLNSTPGPITPITGLVATAGAGTEVTFSGFNNTSVSFGFINPSSVFQGFVEALQTEGLLKIHATPMLTTYNGQPAELLNGGEAPVIVPAGLGTTAIEFKPFGTIMNAVPHILGNGRLKLQIDASVVERDFANSVTVDGITVPSFTVRKVNTGVEMNFGETLVIGGLVQKRETASTSKLPFFGELPWVGAAFRKTSFTEAETELLILITPSYGGAMSTDQVPAGGPGLFTDTVTDTELYGMGMIEVPKTGPECSAIFNCSECGNGNCQCGNGRLNRRAARAGRFGYGQGSSNIGCTDCTPETGQPMMIVPAPSNPEPIPMDNLILPLPADGNPSANADQATEYVPISRSVKQVSAQSSDKQSTNNGTHTDTGRPGLITPFLR